jgi:CyaY protein
MADTLQLGESEFHARVDAILDRIDAVLDEVDSDIDTELNGGILSITFANGSKVIVNRQTPNREIWVAAKSGGFHFRQVAGGPWLDTRSGEALDRLLSRVLGAQADAAIEIAF